MYEECSASFALRYVFSAIFALSTPVHFDFTETSYDAQYISLNEYIWQGLLSFYNRLAMHVKSLQNNSHYVYIFTERGGLYESLAITKHLIKAYVPFLPLEEVHVKKCIKYHLVEKHYFKTSQVIPDELVQRIANELHYIPDDSKRFSSTGCKRVSEKIAYVMDDDD